MRRREIVKLLGGLAVTWAGPSFAQRLARIGYLSVQHRPTSLNDHIFLKGMRAHGYIEGERFLVDWRFAEGSYDSLPQLAVDLVNSNPDVIVATTQLAVKAAQKATNTIPIVMVISNDPVQMGLIESIARPGANTTGVTSADEERLEKQLDLLMRVVPNLNHAVLMGGAGISSARTSGSYSAVQNLRSLARAKGINIRQIVVRNPSEIESAFSSIQQEQVQGIIIRSNPILNEERKRIAELALGARLPSVASRAEFVEAGGLLSYGESLSNLYRRAAYFVDRSLKGVKPSDLPVELPSRFTLTLNLRTAKAFELTIPHDVLTTADMIIE